MTAIAKLLVAVCFVASAGAVFVAYQSMDANQSLQQETEVLRAELDDLREALELRDRYEANQEILADSDPTSMEETTAPSDRGSAPDPEAFVAPQRMADDSQFVEKVAARVSEKLSDPETGTIAFLGDREQLKELYQDIQAEEREARSSRMRDRRVEDVKDRIARYSERLKLAAYQEEELLVVYTESADKIGEAWSKVRSGEGSFMDARTTMEEVRTEQDERAKEILTSEQYTELKVIQAEEDANNPWRRFGRGNNNSNGNSNDGNSNGETRNQ